MNKTLVNVIAVAVIVGGASFYGGIKYDQQKEMASAGQGNFSRGTGMGGGRRGSGMGGDGANGEIIAKDDKSVTIKLRDGGSKIIFVSDATQVTKSASGSLVDIVVGGTIMTFGASNPDGSMTAKSIQIRPKSVSNSGS